MTAVRRSDPPADRNTSNICGEGDHMSIRHVTGALMLPVVLAMTGCATIVGDANQTIPIASTPAGATIVIKDEAGEEVFKGTTPTEVTLKKHNGHYFGGKSFTVAIAKDGFQKQEIRIESHVNGWYIGGNLVFGGLIGYLAVDPFNGGMYTLSPETVSATLPAGVKAAHNNTSTEGIQVVLLSEVPAELRSKLVKIG
jgi:hypothetical protein